MAKKFLNLTIIISFFLTSLGPLPKAHADSNAFLGLPAPGTMINLSPAYQPVIIKGLTVHKDNPFLFDFIVDVGQDKMSGKPLKKEGEKLIKYFLASLAIPDKDVWVNLSPYEKSRIIPDALGQTDMGRDLLEQDYILKQITASLIYPEKQLGKTFWNKVYAKAQEMYGTTQVPVNTFNKVWILADRAEVFEHNQTAFVVDSHMKVMLEEDYLALKKHSVFRGSSIHSLGSQIVRQIILPELEKEVNTGKNFANLRQILNSLILANWYKRNLKQALLNQVYTNQNKIKGINLNDPTVKQQIYEQYLKAYKKGVFNYIKDTGMANGVPVSRKYFSGGFDQAQAVINPMVTTSRTELDKAMLGQNGMFDFKVFADTQPEKMHRRGFIARATGVVGAAALSSLFPSLARAQEAAQGQAGTGNDTKALNADVGRQQMKKDDFKEGHYRITVLNQNIDVILDLIKQFLDDSTGKAYLAPPRVGIILDKELLTMTDQEVVGIIQPGFELQLFKKASGQPSLLLLSPPPRMEVTQNSLQKIKALAQKYWNTKTGQFYLAQPGQVQTTDIKELKKLENLNEILERIQLGGYFRVFEYEEGKNRIIIVPPLNPAEASGGQSSSKAMKVVAALVIAAGISLFPPLAQAQKIEFPQGPVVVDIAYMDAIQRAIESAKGGHILIATRTRPGKEIFPQQNMVNVETEKEIMQPGLIIQEVKRSDGISDFVIKSPQHIMVVEGNIVPTKTLLEQYSTMGLGRFYRYKGPPRQQFDSLSPKEMEEIKFKTVREMIEPNAQVIVEGKDRAGILNFLLVPSTLTDNKKQQNKEDKDKAMARTVPMVDFAKGGIDLSTSSGMQWKITKDGSGVEMNIDPAMIKRIRREGIDSLSPFIYKITPINSIWPLVGFDPPQKKFI